MQVQILLSFLVWTYLCFLTRFTLGSLLPALIHSFLLFVDAGLIAEPLLPLLALEEEREGEDTCSESSEEWD